MIEIRSENLAAIPCKFLTSTFILKKNYVRFKLRQPKIEEEVKVLTINKNKKKSILQMSFEKLFPSLKSHPIELNSATIAVIIKFVKRPNLFNLAMSSCHS